MKRGVKRSVSVTGGNISRRDNRDVMTDGEVIAMEDKFGAHHYHRVPLVVRKAEGVFLEARNENGESHNKLCFDCLNGYSAANQGHMNPFVVKAIKRALDDKCGSAISNIPYSEHRALFLKKLAELVPLLGTDFFTGENNAVLLKNGGTEAVDVAIKAMRKWGCVEKGIRDGKQEIIVFDGNFHGRILSAISFSSHLEYRAGFGPMLQGFKSVPFGDIKAVEEAINPNTCGILVEPIQGEGGIVLPPDGFLKELKLIAIRNRVLLTFDEIQVGLGRTGKMFCFQHENATPDGLILAKSLSGGMGPLSAFVANREWMDIVFMPGTEGSTFGGNGLMCAAGCVALDEIVRLELPERAAKLGAKLKDRLIKLKCRSSEIIEVRGKGLLIGVVTKSDAKVLCQRLLERRVFVGAAGKNVIRICPPLTVEDWQLGCIVERLAEVLK